MPFWRVSLDFVKPPLSLSGYPEVKTFANLHLKGQPSSYMKMLFANGHDRVPKTSGSQKFRQLESVIKSIISKFLGILNPTANRTVEVGHKQFIQTLRKLTKVLDIVENMTYPGLL